MSQEKRLSGSIVIPLIKMLLHTGQDILDKTSNVTAQLLRQNICTTVTNKFDTLEASIVLLLCTLLGS